MTRTLPEHPERNAEGEHLRETLALLEERIAEIGGWKVQGFTTHDAAALHRVLVKAHEGLVTARKQVYFGRLDFTPAGAAGPETHYLGKIGFERGGRIVVVDWRAPVARLFARRRPGEAEYESPDGTVRVRLGLKRHLDVEQQALRGVYDEYDARPDSGRPGQPRAALIDPDAYLREILAGRHTTQLLDIVATLQEHQDELIRADPRQVLVVQGVAGSGKTSVALHRVAFLLYPGNRTGVEAERCIIFGPNQLFLGYIANVLPGLGVPDIHQTTLDAWALEPLGRAGQPAPDATLEALLDARTPEAQRLALARRGRLKASLRMGRVLDSLVAWWRARLAVPLAGLSYPDLGPLKVTVALPQPRAYAIHRALAELPLLRHQERFAEEVLGELLGQYAAAFEQKLEALRAEGERLAARERHLLEDAERLEQHAAYAGQNADADLDDSHAAADLARGAAGLRSLAAYFRRQGERARLRADRLQDEAARGEHRPLVRAALEQALLAELERIWPRLDAAAAYAGLLADARALNRHGRGQLSADEVQLLHQPEAAIAGDLDASDLPAVCYLQTTVEGVPAPLYDHVVVDEAQDVAPLYYSVLRKLSRTGSFTLLGDLAQGVYGHRGLADWDEVRPVFDGLPFRLAAMADSYRSTQEIMVFANRILELLSPPGQPPLLARPFERHGPAVQVTRVARRADLPAALAGALARLGQAGYENIAVVARTAPECQALARDWQAAGFADFQLAAGAEQPYAGGVLLLPVHLAKGMEFDAVLIADASEGAYAATEFDGRLLYVAVTRALHALEIFSAGPLNAIIELALGG